MARHCIYCDRELGEGEKCTCRQPREKGQSSPGASGTAGGAGASGTGSGTSGRTGQRYGKADAGQASWQARWQAWRQSRVRNRTPGAGGQDAGRRQAGTSGSGSQPGRDTGKVRREFMMRLPSILNKLQKAIRYVHSPVDAIRLSVQYPSPKRTLGFLAVLAFMSGLVFTATLRNPQIALIGGTISTLPTLLLFAEGMAFAAAAILLLSLFYMLAIRLLHRHPYAYQNLFDALSPASLYLGLSLLLVYLGLQNSLLSGLTVLAVGYGINYMVQYFVIRQLTNLDENRSAVLVLIANLLCMSALGTVFSLF